MSRHDPYGDEPYIVEESILAQMCVVERPNGGYALQLMPGRFLHWMTPGSNRPVTSNRADMIMRPYFSREEAEQVLEQLREIWRAK